MDCACVDLLVLRGLAELAIDQTRDHINPNKHGDIDLVGTLLLKLQLIDDGDSCCAEHEVNPDAAK